MQRDFDEAVLILGSGSVESGEVFILRKISRFARKDSRILAMSSRTK
jgi:hypothetical protein